MQGCMATKIVFRIYYEYGCALQITDMGNIVTSATPILEEDCARFNAQGTLNTAIRGDVFTFWNVFKEAVINYLT